MVGASWCDCVQCPAPAGGSARSVKCSAVQCSAVSVRQVQQRHHGAPAAHPDQDSISGADIIGALVCKALVGLARLSQVTSSTSTTSSSNSSPQACQIMSKLVQPRDSGALRQGQGAEQGIFDLEHGQIRFVQEVMCLPVEWSSRRW